MGSYRKLQWVLSGGGLVATWKTCDDSDGSGPNEKRNLAALRNLTTTWPTDLTVFRL